MHASNKSTSLQRPPVPLSPSPPLFISSIQSVPPPRPVPVFPCLLEPLCHAQSVPPRRAQSVLSPLSPHHPITAPTRSTQSLLGPIQLIFPRVLCPMMSKPIRPIQSASKIWALNLRQGSKRATNRLIEASRKQPPQKSQDTEQLMVGLNEFFLRGLVTLEFGFLAILL